MGYLLMAIAICIITIRMLYLSIKLDYAAAEIEHYKKENNILKEKNR